MVQAMLAFQRAMTEGLFRAFAVDLKPSSLPVFSLYSPLGGGGWGGGEGGVGGLNFENRRSVFGAHTPWW